MDASKQYLRPTGLSAKQIADSYWNTYLEECQRLRMKANEESQPRYEDAAVAAQKVWENYLAALEASGIISTLAGYQFK